MVTSIASELGLIIDRAGRIIKESTYEALAVAPINTNSLAMHIWISTGPKWTPCWRSTALR